MKRDFFYDEEVIAKRIYENGFQDGYTRWQATMVGKHLRWTLGYGDARVKSALIEFCKSNDRNFNQIRQRRSMANAVKGSREKYVKKASPISITESELDTIRTIKNFKAQKILLGFLIYAKRDGGYVNRKHWMSIRRMVGLKNMGNREIVRFVRDFYNKGVIDIGGSSHLVKFIDQLSDNVMVLSDEKTLYNISNLYKEYFGGEPMWCKECGAEFIKTGKTHNFCEKCSEARLIENWRKNSKNYRKNRHTS
jgi:hypothetical protein